MLELVNAQQAKLYELTEMIMEQMKKEVDQFNEEDDIPIRHVESMPRQEASKPKGMPDTPLESRIKAVKPCEKCSFGPVFHGNCRHSKDSHIIKECGPEVIEMKQHALKAGELEIKIIGGEIVREYQVYREGKYIGIIPYTRETEGRNGVISKLEGYSAGRNVLVRSRPHKKQNPDSLYTNAEFTILGELNV